MARPAKTSWMDLLGRQIIRPRQGTVRRERQFIIKMVACLLLYGASATAYVWIHLQNISMGYAVARISRVQDELLQQKSELLIEWEMLRAPQRIARIAEQELGMVPADPYEMVIVK